MANDQMMTLYLTSWQKRMVKDFVSRSLIKAATFSKITKVEIGIIKGHCLASYKLPAMGLRRDDWLLYLTDEQMNHVRETAGLRTPISAINISAEAMKAGEVRFA